MSEPAKLLTGIPQEERAEALQYYENYFNSGADIKIIAENGIGSVDITFQEP